MRFSKPFLQPFALDEVHRRPAVPENYLREDHAMQILECTQYIRAPHKTLSHVRGNLSRETVPVIRLYGCTAQGQSVLWNVYNFEPYLWVEAPPGWCSAFCEPFRVNLNHLMAPNTRSQETVVAVEEHQRESLLYYSLTGKRTFLKIIVQMPGFVPKVRSVVENGLTCPKMWEGMHRFLTYESNVLFPLRFLVDKDIGGSNWVVLPKGTFCATERKTSTCQIEIDVSAEHIIAHDAVGEWMGIAPMRLLSLDIECQGRKGFFPEPDKDPVIQIAAHGTVQGDPDFVCRKVFTLNTCANIAGAQVHSYDSEAAMLIAFSEFLRHFDPDFLVGYNILNFDFWYLHERAITLQITNKFAIWSRILDERTQCRTKMFQSKQSGNREYKELICDGRVPLDVLMRIQRDYRLRSYSLNSVSQFFLGEQKEDVHHSIISDLQEGNEETRRRLAVYCLKDALLPLRLIDKLMLLINNIEMARVSGVPIGWLLERGQQIKVFSQMLRKAKNKDLLFPAVERHVSNDAVGYEGATVIPPQRGFYPEPIATLDFASLYPSIMMAHNLCYSTLVRPSEVDKLDEDKYIRTPSGDRFVKGTVFRGILPEILEEFLAARKKAKKDMANAKSPLEYAVLNGRQLALKISANSVYGFTGAQVGKLPCLEISASVTSFGRQMIEQTKSLVESRYTIENGYGANANVIYGDTDSVMVDFGVKKGPEVLDRDKLQAAMDLGNEAAEFVSSSFPSPIKLEFEKVYFPYMLMNKKRYAGLLWTKPDSYDKLDVKGLEAVRRDNCPLVANVVSTVLNKILIQRSVPKAVDYVKQVIGDLLMNRLDISHLVISKSYSKAAEEYAAKQAHVALAERMKKRDPATAPVIGDRVPYVLIKGVKGARAFERSEDPIYVLENNIAIDAKYYLEHQLENPLKRLFEGIIDNPDSLLNGDHTRHISVALPNKVAGGIMKFAKVNLQCLGCRSPLSAADGTRAVCKNCQDQEVELYLRTLEKRNHYENLFGRVWTQCQRCQGSLHQDVLCSSRDCPVFYMRKKVQKDLKDQQDALERFGCVEW
eukprot:PhM_4_TR10095/c0_g1_i1/m.19641/K02327/POLD1; DNA polymerase delta subunit 1